MRYPLFREHKHNQADSSTGPDNAPRLYQKMHMILIRPNFQKRDPFVPKLDALAYLLDRFIYTFIYHYATVFCRTYKGVHKVRYIVGCMFNCLYSSTLLHGKPRGFPIPLPLCFRSGAVKNIK